MTTQPLVLRAVTADDVPAVLELIAGVLGEFSLEFGKGAATDDELHELPASYTARGGAFWVALHGATLVGTCGTFPIAPPTYELRKMYLLPSARGLGLGAKLLDEAVAWTRSQGGTRLVLDTVEQMTRAIAFYEAHGFVRDDQQVRGSRCTRGYVRVL